MVIVVAASPSPEDAALKVASIRLLATKDAPKYWRRAVTAWLAKQP